MSIYESIYIYLLMDHYDSVHHWASPCDLRRYVFGLSPWPPIDPWWNHGTISWFYGNGTMEPVTWKSKNKGRIRRILGETERRKSTAEDFSAIQAWIHYRCPQILWYEQHLQDWFLTRGYMHSPTRGHTPTHMHTRIYHEHRLLHWYMCTLYSTVVWSTLWPILRRANPAQPSEHIGVQVFPLTWTSKEHWQRFVIFMFCCIWAESSFSSNGGIK